MVENFANQGTADIHHGLNSKAARKTLPPEHWERARELMMQLDACGRPEDMREPPGNRLKRLKGSSFYSVRINSQWRLVFRFEGGLALDVAIVDYH